MPCIQNWWWRITGFTNALQLHFAVRVYIVDICMCIHVHADTWTCADACTGHQTLNNRFAVAGREDWYGYCDTSRVVSCGRLNERRAFFWQENGGLLCLQTRTRLTRGVIRSMTMENVDIMGRAPFFIYYVFFCVQKAIAFNGASAYALKCSSTHVHCSYL